jgi:hypothetical protein
MWSATVATLFDGQLDSRPVDNLNGLVQHAEFVCRQAVHLPLGSRLFDRMLDLAFRATPKKEVGLAVTGFGYAILMGTEGVGLYLRRSWAHWFTREALPSYKVVDDVAQAGPTTFVAFVMAPDDVKVELVESKQRRRSAPSLAKAPPSSGRSPRLPHEFLAVAGASGRHDWPFHRSHRVRGEEPGGVPQEARSRRAELSGSSCLATALTTPMVTELRRPSGLPKANTSWPWRTLS